MQSLKVLLIRNIFTIFRFESKAERQLEERLAATNFSLSVNTLQLRADKFLIVFLKIMSEHLRKINDINTCVARYYHFAVGAFCAILTFLYYVTRNSSKHLLSLLKYLKNSLTPISCR
jgi:hypothetical protein